MTNIQDLKTEIRALRDQLNDVDKQKEDWFAKKDEHSKSISEKIAQVKSLKNERDALTKEVQSLKEQRKKYNTVVSDKIANFKDMVKDQKPQRRGPSRAGAKQQIEKLELKIETEPMGKEAEKKVMKQIKSLKKELGDTKAQSASNKESKSLSKEIDEAKKEAEVFHSQIQEKAALSQEKHEDMLKLSDEIDALKVKEDEAFKSFSELKEQFKAINAKLKDKLQDAHEIGAKVSEDRDSKRRKKEESQAKDIQEKQRSVEDKIARGEKLTTEDLVAFQGRM